MNVFQSKLFFFKQHSEQTHIHYTLRDGTVMTAYRCYKQRPAHTVSLNKLTLAVANVVRGALLQKMQPFTNSNRNISGFEHFDDMLFI